MTKNPIRSSCLWLGACTAIALNACSSAPKNKPVQISSTAPTVVNARAEPGTVVLNGELQPVDPARVLADIKDFNSKVVDAHLKFADVPMEIPMENIGGTTWKAELTPQELQMLAVSGKTINYHAQIIARDAHGEVSEAAPVNIAVKAPDYAHQFG